MAKEEERPLPMGIVHLGNKVFKGKCQSCKNKRRDLSVYRNKFVCRDCMCPPDYDPMTMAYLSIQATGRRWSGF
jgi:hypothetical protein